MVKRRLLHVLAPARYGGLERVVHSLVTAQHGRGDAVFVATLIERDAPEPDLLSQLRECGAQVIPINLPSRAYGARLLALREVCSNVRADVIHSHGYVADVFLAVSRGGIPSPVLTTVHGFTGGSRKNRAYEWLQRRAFRRLDAIVAVSTKLGTELKRDGVCAGRIHVIPNACPAERDPMSQVAARSLLAIPEGLFSIGWLGRVSYEKGLDVLIDALSRLHSMDWRLTVVGDGKERVELEESARRLGIADRIVWRGAVANAAELLRAFDVLVMSSRTEGTPMTLFEGMSSCVPVVTTAVGGIPDVVTCAEALLVPSEDAGALAVAIQCVQQNPHAATERASRAHVRLRRDFAMNPFLARYDRVYDAIRTRV